MRVLGVLGTPGTTDAAGDAFSSEATSGIDPPGRSARPVGTDAVDLGERLFGGVDRGRGRVGAEVAARLHRATSTRQFQGVCARRWS
jgi:hypothetical protein